MESNAAVDENEGSLYAMFRKSANLLSQFYSQSIHNQNLAFEAGESYAIVRTLATPQFPPIFCPFNQFI